jgi:hypothetical protein
MDNLTTQLIPCNGCEINDPAALTTLKENNNKMKAVCLFFFNKAKCTKINVNPICHQGYRCSLSPYILFDLADAAFNYPPCSSLLPHNHFPPISSIFDHNTTNFLTNIAHSLTNRTHLQFYTDGSVSKIGTSSTRMGVAWLLTDPLVSTNSFCATLNAPSPSSSLAELVAVIAAVITSPHNSIVEICTDSLVTIKNFHHFQHILSTSPTLNPSFKIECHSLWHALFKILSTKRIIINFTKVQGHSDN